MMADGVELLVTWICFFNVMYKNVISLFREIELIWLKAIATETGVILAQSDCLWVPWEHKSSADHNGGQAGCKWTSQIWNVAHCLGALGRGHCAYAYDISRICRNIMCLHSWIDKLLISPVILIWQLVEKNFYKLLSRSVPSSLHLMLQIWWKLLLWKMCQ